MGQPKESLEFGDSTLLGHTAELLLDCTWPVVVVGRGGDQQLPPLPLEAHVLHDHQPGAGPLAAMVTGMRHVLANGDLTPQDAVFVVATDHPFLSAEAVGWLARQMGDQQAVMARVDDVLQPLCAVYRLDVLPAAEALLQEGVATPRTLAEKVRCRVLSRQDVAAFDPALRFLQSINTPDDRDRLLGDAE